MRAPTSVTFSFEQPGNAKSCIVQHHVSASEPAGSLLGRGDSTGALSVLDLGELHAELKRHGCGASSPVTEAIFRDALRALLTGADCPADEVISALFRAFDTDRSGQVDEAELIAGCSQLCSGDASEKLRLAFACFDKDGDGHLDPGELQTLLRGTIAPAVSALHSAVDFASFSAEGAALVDEVNDEAGGAAALALEDGKLRVELKTPMGAVTIHVPPEALSVDNVGAQGSALSLEEFLRTIVEGAMTQYDTDGNGTLEMEEFVAFAASNAFLAAWFGRLASKGTKKASWKDDLVVT